MTFSGQFQQKNVLRAQTMIFSRSRGGNFQKLFSGADDHEKVRSDCSLSGGVVHLFLGI